MQFKKILQSIAVVLAGFVTVFALSVLMDVIVEGVGIFPSQNDPAEYQQWMLALALAYRTAFTVLGGYVTARLAPQNSLKHAVILGVIGTCAGLAGVIAAWSFGNHWYPIALTILALPSTWYGGKLTKKR